MSDLTVTLADAFAGPSVTLYGNPVSDFRITEEQASAAKVSAERIGPAQFARIRGFRIGTGRCVPLPIPTLLVVFGDGQELTESECGFHPGEVLKWKVPVGTQILALEPSQGNVEEVVETLAARGIDGGLSFDNPRYENGKLCVDVHIWAKISILGWSAKFDERFPVCINIGQQCITVWDIGFARLEICYRAPNQICGRLCVGRFGIEKCWDQCVTIPITTETSISATAGCDCTSSVTQSALAPYSRERDACVSVTIENGKACLNVPIYGSVCIDVPSSIPNGTLAEACVDICKKFGIPCGVEAYIKVAGQTVASKDWGCC